MELLFKRFQQSLCITATKEGNTKYAEALVFLQLIIWGIAKRQTFYWERFLEENTETIYYVYEVSIKTKVLSSQPE